MTDLNMRDLDRYITGDYGQDGFRCSECRGFHEDRDEDDGCPDIEDDFDHEREAEARADAREEREDY